ncbi:TetR/AcrR family transcriptional regulator [Raineyella fluvialis]|uniref:TetR family transcriptional regulator n=1 Tax=Raineyella fluvialis TaxID=2662261 RepID=A0A5Q2FH32_9ACTN|nr:TetR/AcrR family transcriptional regulator [Raineyella fluvialis]QGF23626.1 TetR family transcriptional regulator [Raineyella fluvialis]
MGRVSKAPEERRDELLDTALRLCTTVGYDALSIDQLTREAGVAKGTFYYYFGSKQDMLGALVQRFVDGLFASLEAGAQDLTGTGADRFGALLGQATAWKTERVEDAMAFIPLLYKPENVELRHRLFDLWHDRTRDLFRPLVALGSSDGTFMVAEVDATTDLVLSLWLDASTRIFEDAIAAGSSDGFADHIVRGMTALTTAAERILGAREGTFAIPLDHAMVRGLHPLFMAALAPGTASTPSTGRAR